MSMDDDFWDWYCKEVSEATSQELAEYELGIHPLQIKEREGKR